MFSEEDWSKRSQACWKCRSLCIYHLNSSTVYWQYWSLENSLLLIRYVLLLHIFLFLLYFRDLSFKHITAHSFITSLTSSSFSRISSSHCSTQTNLPTRITFLRRSSYLQIHSVIRFRMWFQVNYYAFLVSWYLAYVRSLNVIRWHFSLLCKLVEDRHYDRYIFCLIHIILLNTCIFTLYLTIYTYIVLVTTSFFLIFVIYTYMFIMFWKFPHISSYLSKWPVPLHSTKTFHLICFTEFKCILS